MRISDWSSDVCSSDLVLLRVGPRVRVECLAPQYPIKPMYRRRCFPRSFGGQGFVARAPRPRRQVAVDRLVSQLRPQRHAAANGDQLRYRRLRIAEVAGMPRAGRPGLHADRLATALVQLGRASWWERGWQNV